MNDEKRPAVTEHPLDELVGRQLNTQEIFDWEAGYDSVAVANIVNCHFSHFRSERSTLAWEAGRNAALAGKPKPAFDPHARAHGGKYGSNNKASPS